MGSLSSNLEDYVEAIYLLETGRRVARVSEIAKNMGVSSSSVTGALRALSKKKLVKYRRYEPVVLTEQGIKVARTLRKRREMFRRLLVNILEVDEITAQRNAHALEHAIDSDVMERFLRFLEFIENCPRKDRFWGKEKRRFCVRPHEATSGGDEMDAGQTAEVTK